MLRPLLLATTLLLLAAAPAQATLAELVTVTPTSAVVTWTTDAPGDSTLCLDARPCVAQEPRETYHRVTLDGLAPGSLHTYSVSTNGVPELPSLTNPGTFTTLTPPPGKHLFRFAVMSDLHVGEGCAGTITSTPLGSFPPCFSAPDYAEKMDAAQIGEIKAAGIDVTLIGGDVTSEARPAETAKAKELLERLPGTVVVARGNHDRVHAENACPDHDCFRQAFYPGRTSARTYSSVSRHGYRFIALDSVMGGSTGDLRDADQNAWLARELAAHKSQPTFLVFHHPVSVYSDVVQAEPVIFGVPPYQGGTEFLETVARNPQIVGVLQAHTHRNFNSYGNNDTTPFIENGSSKEYPGGYSVFDVYEGGYTRSYVRPSSCAFCREWTQTTSGEIFGLAPMYTLGAVGTRNFTHVYGCAAQLPAATLPGNDSLLTGGVQTPPASCLDRVRPAGTLEPDDGGALGAAFALTRRSAGVRRAALRRGPASGVVALRCTGTVACVVRGKVVTTIAAGGAKRTIVLATARGTVRGGATGRVRLRLTARGRAALRRHARVRARAQLAVQVADGDVRALRGRITLARR